MKLYLNKTSPYARLVLATAHETGLATRLETVWLEPWDDPGALLAVNAAAKVPALVTDTGTAITESALLCDYLLGLSGRREAMMPADGAAAESALRRLGLARSAIDCSFGAVIQRRFNDGRDTGLSERWLRALPRIAGSLNQALDGERAAETFDLADLASAVAFEYVDFRLPEVRWRDAAPRLAGRLAAQRDRPCLAATRPG